MKFLADDMLGKLSRWLRMLGLDVAYYNVIEDTELLKICEKETRTLLTRDTRLIKTLTPGSFLFISHDYLDDQLAEFFTQYPELYPQLTPLSRCVECNELLKNIPKTEAEGKVWEYVFQTQNIFTQCPKCEKIYWKATHVRAIENRFKHFESVIKKPG